MAVTSEATTVWSGDLRSGTGTTTLDSSDSAGFPVTWQARSEGAAGKTTPEELLAAAHSSCFSMKLSSLLAKHGTPAETLHVTAAVTFEPDEGVTGSHILLHATVPGIGDDDFQSIASEAKSTCPVSRALVGIPITMEASLA